MSTILKALRRVEDDRNAQAPPPIREQVATRPDDDGSRMGWAAMLAALVAGVAVGILVLVFWPTGEASDAEELDPGKTHTASPAATEPPAPPPRARPRVARLSSLPPESEIPKKLARIPRNLPSAAAPPVVGESFDPNALSFEALRSKVAVIARPPAVSRLVPAPKAEAPGTDIAAAVVAPTGESQAAVAPSVTRPAPSKVASEPVRIAARKPAPKPKPAAEEATRRSPKAPPAPVAQIPPTPTPEIVRPLFPEVVVTQTVWHPRAERRTVRVEVSGSAAVDLQEGDWVGPLQVGTIEPSGVVFLHDGVEIRRRVGEGG